MLLITATLHCPILVLRMLLLPPLILLGRAGISCWKGRTLRTNRSLLSNISEALEEPNRAQFRMRSQRTLVDPLAKTYCIACLFQPVPQPKPCMLVSGGLAACPPSLQASASKLGISTQNKKWILHCEPYASSICVIATQDS